MNLIARTAYPVANAPGTHHFLVCAPAPSTHTHAGVLAEDNLLTFKKKKPFQKAILWSSSYPSFTLYGCTGTLAFQSTRSNHEQMCKYKKIPT